MTGLSVEDCNKSIGSNIDDGIQGTQAMNLKAKITCLYDQDSNKEINCSVLFIGSFSECREKLTTMMSEEARDPSEDDTPNVEHEIERLKIIVEKLKNDNNNLRNDLDELKGSLALHTDETVSKIF